jgi:hypothetical protein
MGPGSRSRGLSSGARSRDPLARLSGTTEIDSTFKQPFPSWPGFVPAIHVFILGMPQDVDARVKPGHDELESVVSIFKQQT